MIGLTIQEFVLNHTFDPFREHFISRWTTNFEYTELGLCLVTIIINWNDNFFNCSITLIYDWKVELPMQPDRSKVGVDSI